MVSDGAHFAAAGDVWSRCTGVCHLRLAAGVCAAPVLSEEAPRAAGTSLRFLLVVLSDEDASLNLAWSFKSPASAHAHTVPLFFLWVVGHTAG